MRVGNLSQETFGERNRAALKETSEDFGQPDDEGQAGRPKHLPEGSEEAYDELYYAKIGWDQICLQRAVKWVMHAREPLSTEMLLSAVQLGPKNDDGELGLDIAIRIPESALESICRRLIVKDPLGNWDFSQSTVKEYFRGEKHKSWSSKDAETELATLSLLLLTDNFRNYHLPDSVVEAGTLINSARGDDEAQDPVICLRSYVAKHWASHVKASSSEDDETTSVSPLLKSFMIARDGSHSSSSVYQTWARYISLKVYDEEDSTRILGRRLKPTENPAFGIAALGLHTIAKRWGQDCLNLNLTNISKDGLDLLSLAARYGHAELCDKLIKWGSDVNRILPTGDCPLSEAINARQTACVSELLERGADPNIETETRPLCHAARVPPDLKLVELLLNHGADPNGICTPRCHFACALEATAYGDNLDIAERLIQAGATVNLDGGGQYGSPLAAAAYYGSLDLADLLISSGADVNGHLEASYFGGVLAAAFCGDQPVSMVTHLIEKAGADPRRIVSDLSAKKPWVSGTNKGSRGEIARYLYSHNHANINALRSLDKGLPGGECFSYGFISSLQPDETWEATPQRDFFKRLMRKLGGYY